LYGLLIAVLVMGFIRKKKEAWGWKKMCNGF
jgi:hypothetical protein